MNIFKLTLFTILAIGITQARSDALSDIQKKVDELLKIEVKEFASVIEGKTSEIDEFLLKKQKVCLGEFSTIVLSDDGSLGEGEARKLSDEEREVCLKDLKRLQLKYVNNLFKLKKSYIDYLYQERLKSLKAAKEKELKKLR